MIFLFSMPWYYLQPPHLLSLSTVQAHLYHKVVRNLIIMVVIEKKNPLYRDSHTYTLEFYCSRGIFLSLRKYLL